MLVYNKDIEMCTVLPTDYNQIKNEAKKKRNRKKLVFT